MHIINLFYKAQAIAEQSKRYSQRHFKLIGAIAFITLPLSTVIESAVGDPAFNTFYIRMLAGCAGMLLILHERLPQPLQKNLEWVWIAGVTFVLPYSFGLILTLNAALTDPGTSPSPVWVYQYLVALFLHIQLINHGPLSVLLWMIATLGVFVTALPVASPNLPALKDAWLYPLPVYMTALIVGSITNRNVHMVQSEQLRAASAIGSNIAHELRTPLASIRLLAHGMRRFLPQLVDAYKQAELRDPAVEPITAHQLSQIAVGLESIQAEVGYSNTIIDMLLVNTSDRAPTADVYETFMISLAVEEAIARFPFNNSTERGLVNAKVVQDFCVTAPRPLIVHVLFNLIKNGLYFVQKSGSGIVELIATRHREKGILEVKDTGIGIPASLQPRIFDRFFSSAPSSQGAGIGLSFCKMVMESIGGEIRCESREGQYTAFRLIFPSKELRPPTPSLRRQEIKARRMSRALPASPKIPR